MLQKRLISALFKNFSASARGSFSAAVFAAIFAASSAISAAEVLDFPGDSAPDGEWLVQDFSAADGAQTPTAQGFTPPSELEPQLVLLLTLLPREKLYALKLALDRAFAEPAAAEPEPKEPEYKQIHIKMHDGERSRSFNIKAPKTPAAPVSSAPEPADSAVQIRLK